MLNPKALFTKITVILDKNILTISPPGYNLHSGRRQTVFNTRPTSTCGLYLISKSVICLLIRATGCPQFRMV